MTIIAQPYTKKYDEQGFISNPITLENPYLHTEGVKSRAERRGRIKFLPTGFNGYLQQYRKSATGNWVRA